jgi:hypothetical protein
MVVVDASASIVGRVEETEVFDEGGCLVAMQDRLTWNAIDLQKL